MLSEFKDIIATLGFPICVALWLLIRTDGYIRQMNRALDELIQLLRSKNGKV